MHRDPGLAPSRGESALLPGASRSIWQAVGIALLLGLGVVIAVFYSAFTSAVATWNQSTAHQFSYLVIPVSMYFVWIRRQRLALSTPSPDLRMVWLAIPCGLVWLISHVAQIAIGEQFAAVGMVQILLLALLGREIYRVLLFPLMFLWLLVPFGDFLTEPLMELTSAMTVAGLTLFGIDAYAQGTVLIAAGSPYLIVEECAALDFIIGNLVISLVYANLMFSNTAKRWLYALAAVPVAILANGFRTTTVVLITHVSDGQIGLAHDHAAYGWFVFLLAVAAQMWAGWRYHDPDATPAVARSVGVHKLSLQRVALTWVVAVVAISAAPGYAAFAVAGEVPVSNSLCWPELPIDGYTVVPDPAWQPRFAQAHGNLHALLESDFGALDLHIAYFWRQQQGAELINAQNRVYDGDRWNFLARTADELIVDGKRISVNRVSLRGPNFETRSVFYWYWVDGAFTDSAIHAKLLQIKAAVLFGEQRAAMIGLSIERGVAGQREREAVQSVLDRAPFVVRTLQKVRTTADGKSYC